MYPVYGRRTPQDKWQLSLTTTKRGLSEASLEAVKQAYGFTKVKIAEYKCSRDIPLTLEDK